MSPGISPGSPPSGYRRDTKGWHPPTGIGKKSYVMPLSFASKIELRCGRATYAPLGLGCLPVSVIGPDSWLLSFIARAGPMNCVPYPRANVRPVARPIQPIPEPEWWKELEDYKSRPVGQLADIIPQVALFLCFMYSTART